MPIDASQFLSGYTSMNETCDATLTGNIREEDTFRILLASDIHLGYCDNNPGRENDSFTTFDEILKIGRDENVDFVLLGGDLFHENKPKPATLQRATEIMRKHCLGSKAIEFEYLGDPKVDFPNQEVPEVNYMDPDINIAMPVFTIHGNHDDPVGAKKTSAVDHLVAARLLNHFGQWDDLNKISVKAVPFVKGDTKLALFGLGNVKDDRLYRLIRDNHVKFVRPKESADDWFNIFVLHQNRVAHGPKNYIPESYIPAFFDLAVWGHEHECRIDPEITSAQTDVHEAKTYIIQPGSPVATSLCYGEAKEKHVGILSVHRRKFRLEKIKLKTVRPMLLEDISLFEVIPTLKIGKKDKDLSSAIETYVSSRIDMKMHEAEDLYTGHPDQPIEPLVRIRVFHENVGDAFNPVRYAQKWSGKIMNEDIVTFKRTTATKRNKDGEMEFEDMDEIFKGAEQNGQDLDSHVEAIVESFFAKARESGDTANILEVLSEKGLSEAVKSSVEKDDRDAISLVIETQVEKAFKYLTRLEITEENIEDALEGYRAKRLAKDEDGEEALNLLRSRPVKKRADRGGGEDDEDEDDDRMEEDEDEPSVIEEDDDDDGGTSAGSRSARGRGAPRGRGKAPAAAARGGAGRGRGRGRGKAAAIIDSDSDSTPSRPAAKGGRGSRGGGGAGSRGGGGGASTSRGKKSSPNDPPAAKKPMVQTTLNIQSARRSPRKGGAATVFDVSDDSD